MTFVSLSAVWGTAANFGECLQNLGNQIIAESVLFDKGGCEAARRNGVFVKSKIALSPEIGYA